VYVLILLRDAFTFDIKNGRRFKSAIKLFAAKLRRINVKDFWQQKIFQGFLSVS